MTAHTLHATQFIARPIDEVFAFFSRAENLARITPPGMGFEFLTRTTRMRDGTEIEYRIRPLLGIPTRWRTGSRLRAADPFHRPPGARPVPPLGAHPHVLGRRGGTLVEDEVAYEMPFGSARRDRSHGWSSGRAASGSSGTGPGPSRRSSRRRVIDRPLTVAVAGGTGFVGGAIAASCIAAAPGRRPLAPRSRRPGARCRSRSRSGAADVATGSAASTQHWPASTRSSSRSPSGTRRSRRRGAAGRSWTVDAAGTERLVAAAARPASAALVYISGAGAAPDARASLVPRQVARRGGRPRLRAGLHDHPADLDLRARATSRSTGSSASPARCRSCR